MCALGVLIIAIVGLSPEASAQVYRGTITSPQFPGFALDIGVIVRPGGHASYSVNVGAEQIDWGILVASVSGGSVSGYLQSVDPTVGPCFFGGTYDGTTAVLTLDPSSCDGPGTIILTKTNIPAPTIVIRPAATRRGVRPRA
jgi:hypothetical protein